eukprot:1619095-Prymnesium_polylepis.1
MPRVHEGRVSVLSRPDSDRTRSPQQHLRASCLQAHLALSYFRWPARSSVPSELPRSLPSFNRRSPRLRELFGLANRLRPRRES